MLSIVVPVRNTRTYGGNCLRSILDTLDRLRLAERAEVILMDDESDPADNIPELFRTFKQTTKSSVIAFRFKKRQHYSRACAVGFSLTQGDAVLLLSHDMVLTPSYLATLLAVSALDGTHGIVRGTSPYVDGYPQHEIKPPLFPYLKYEDIVAFSQYIQQCNGLLHVEDPQLCGDSFLMKRQVLQKIGVMDGRYFGYFGDVDFGLRAQRAGFKLICAKGAWLHHVGAAAYRDQSKKSQQDLEQVQVGRMRVVNEAYQAFRAKWDLALPETYAGKIDFDLEKLRLNGPITGADFQPEIEMDMDEVEVI